MRAGNFIQIICLVFCLASHGIDVYAENPGKTRLLVVDSYHKGYNWSNDTNEGFCEAMLKYGYFDNDDDIEEFNRRDYVETSQAVVKKLWMDSKRRKKNPEISDMTDSITWAAEEFKPDLIFLGDDNAAKHIGNRFLDSEIPIVLWGINDTPLKYGLINSIEKPGHNVTGVYQSGYYAEGIRLLKTMVPNVKTFAVLTDDSPTGRVMLEKLNRLARNGDLPIELLGAVSVDTFEEWKRRSLEMQRMVGAFFIAQYNALHDETGKYVSNDEVAEWYLENINIPEVAVAGQFVRQGLLCAADDAGFNQGFDAVVIANDILTNGADPATYRPVTPKRGALTVNRQRAEMLGINISDDMGIEEYVERAEMSEY